MGLLPHVESRTSDCGAGEGILVVPAGDLLIVYD